MMKMIKNLIILIFFLLSYGILSATSINAPAMEDGPCTDPPEALCHSLFRAELNESCVVTVTANDIDAGSWDDRTIPADLNLEIAFFRNGVAYNRSKSLRFNCLDIDSVKSVILYVKDAEGNESSCVSWILIEEGNCPIEHPSCPPEQYLIVGGNVITRYGEPLRDIDLYINNDFAATIDDLFSFQLLKDRSGKAKAAFRISKEDEVRNGVNTLDMIWIRRHLLELDTLSEIQLRAADFNGDNSLNTLDLILLRREILGLSPSSTRNTEWTFMVDNPEGRPNAYPDFDGYNIDSNKDELEINFIGTKLGDVNGDVDLNRSQNETITIKAYDRNLDKDEEFGVDFFSPNFRDLIGYQFTLEFDPELLEFVAYDNAQADQISAAELENGLITVSVDLESNGYNSFIKPKFRAKKDVKLSEVMAINSNVTEAEAYDRSNETYILELEFEDLGGPALLEENWPNPFTTFTNIDFVLAESQAVSIEIYDVNGRKAYEIQKLYTFGYNRHIIIREHLRMPGLYFYRLVGKDFSLTGKMLMQ